MSILSNLSKKIKRQCRIYSDYVFNLVFKTYMKRLVLETAGLGLDCVLTDLDSDSCILSGLGL